MNSAPSLFRIPGIVLGGLGLALCLALLVAAWVASSRVARVAERASAELDETLATIGQRVEKSRNRFRTAKSTMEEIQSLLADWAGREAGEQASLRMQADEKSQEIANSLQRADYLLEVAASLAKLVDHAQALGVATPSSGDEASKGGLNEEIATVRKRLDSARDDVARVREQLDALNADPPTSERIERAVELGVHSVGTLDWMNVRLEAIAEKVRGAQTRLQGFSSRTQRWTSLATLGLTGVLLLMAGGQAALCRLAWMSGRSDV